MFRNYLVVAIRSLLKNKGLTAINICGLSIGMASVVLIILYIQHELSYDRFHSKADRIHVVLRELKLENSSRTSRGVSGALGPALERDYPEVERAVRFMPSPTWMISGAQRFEQRLFHADPGFFDVFDVEFVSGDVETIQKEPYSLVVTEEMARKFFGSENPIGKVLTLEHYEVKGDLTVVGVVKAWPENSTLYFDCITTTPTGAIARIWDRWDGAGASASRLIQTALLLRENSDYKRLEKNMQRIFSTYIDEKVAANNVYHLQPLTRLRLHSMADYGLQTGGDIQQVYMLGGIACFILVLACINFVNLATARSARRAREVGLRKVVGAERNQLIRQFMGESVLVALIAMVVAVVLVELALPAFNGFTHKSLVLLQGGPLLLVVGLVGLAIAVGLGAGAYPALYLSACDPVDVLNGMFIPGTTTSWLRKGLVTVQFAVSIVFISATTIVYQQLNYVQTKNLGFDKERIVVLKMFWHSRQVHRGDRQGEILTRRYREVKEAFKAHPNVLDATTSRFPQGTYTTVSTFTVEGSDANWQVGLTGIDEAYLQFFGIELLHGRNLTYDDFLTYPKKGAAFLINETAAKQWGWDNPLGKKIRERGYRPGEVIGVVKDFHVQSLHYKIRPVAMTIRPSGTKWLYLKLGPNDIPGTLEAIKETWQHFLPERPFSFYFLDDYLDYTHYAREIQLQKMYSAFSSLAIFVACLGLFGLISFVMEQKVKEIGIRKTLGASVPNLFLMLSSDFVKLIVLANVIAWPVVYFIMDRWLQGFVYRIDLSVFTLLLGGVLTLLVAFLTMSYQTFKAACANPVESLRTE